MRPLGVKRGRIVPPAIIFAVQASYRYLRRDSIVCRWGARPDRRLLTTVAHAAPTYDIAHK